MDNMKCCICLESDIDKMVSNPTDHYRCSTCNEGLVCSNCIREFDPRGVVYLDNKDDKNDVIRCPCCRTLNWKYYHDCFVSYFENVLYEDTLNGMLRHHKVLEIFQENYVGGEDMNITGIVCNKCGNGLPPHSEEQHLDISNGVHMCPTHKVTVTCLGCSCVGEKEIFILNFGKYSCPDCWT